MFEATCHCGNIRLSVNSPADSLTSCNCSICHRLGALWAYYSASEVIIDVGGDSSVAYEWGDKTMKYHRCCRCGCTTYYTTTESNGNRLVAINCRMVDPKVIESLQVKYFDGAVSWRYLDE